MSMEGLERFILLTYVMSANSACLFHIEYATLVSVSAQDTHPGGLEEGVSVPRSGPFDGYTVYGFLQFVSSTLAGVACVYSVLRWCLAHRNQSLEHYWARVPSILNVFFHMSVVAHVVGVFSRSDEIFVGVSQGRFLDIYLVSTVAVIFAVWLKPWLWKGSSKVCMKYLV
jgi:hypothetical protein